jgi:hypothetical protein
MTLRAWRGWWPKNKPSDDWKCDHGVEWSWDGDCEKCRKTWLILYTETLACLEPLRSREP